MALSPRSLAALSITAALLTGGAAQATTLSFASDDDSSAFTLIGTAGAGGMFSITNGRDPAFTPLTLRIDDDNMAQPTASLPVGLRVSLTASYVGSQPVGGGQSHIYTVSGQYSFVNPTTNAELMRVTVAPGSSNLTIGGSASSWGSAGSIFGSDAAFGSFAGVNWIVQPEMFSYANSQGVNPSLYGLDAFAFLNEDFAFTLTNLNSGAGAAIDPVTKLPLASWGSEASHSSHAVPVPAPAGAVALSMAGLGLLARRRRAAR